MLKHPNSLDNYNDSSLLDDEEYNSLIEEYNEIINNDNNDEESTDI